MNAETFMANFGHLADAPGGVAKLRQMILQLAVQGKLVEQDPEDEPASELIEEIHAQKQKLVDAKTIAKPKKLPKITPEALPFAVAHGWTWIRLESTCKVITKGSSPKWQGINYVEDSKDGVLFITSENVGTYTMRKLDEPKFVEKRFNEMETRSILQRNDILINLVGASIGRSALWDRADVANINQAVGIIRLVPDCRSLNLRYLLHYLNSPTCLAIMFENQVETARANISLTNVKHFLVPLPPLAEQKRIVAKVDELMTLCDQLESQQAERNTVHVRLGEAALARLTTAEDDRSLADAWSRVRGNFDLLYSVPENVSQLRQAILQLAVQGKLVEQDPGDEPAEELSMEELSGRNNLKNGLSLKQTTAKTPYRCLRLSALRDGVVDCSDGKPIPLLPDKAEPYLIRKGDVFIVRGNGSKDLIGRAGIVNTQPRNMIFPDLFIRTPLDTKRILPRYFLIVWNSPEMRGRIKYVAKTTSGIWKINQGHIAALTLRVPPLAEQKRIVAKVDELMTLCDQLEAQLTQQQTDADRLSEAMVGAILTEPAAAELVAT